MYLQITERCNMRCRHCGFGCTDKGRDMNKATFNKAVEVLGNCETIISLGGGEPTLHPNFWEFLGLSIGQFDHTWLATNGSQTAISLTLAKLAAKGVIGCALSIDPYHDEIERIVEEAFDRGEKAHYSNSDDLREIRTVDQISRIGRAIDMPEADDLCICPELFIDPIGNVYQCGCKSLLYGNLHDPDFNIPNEATEWFGYCAKTDEVQNELLPVLHVQERRSEGVQTRDPLREESCNL